MPIDPGLAEEWDALADGPGRPRGRVPAGSTPGGARSASGDLEVVTARSGGGARRRARRSRASRGRARAAANWHSPEPPIVSADAEARPQLGREALRQGAERHCCVRCRKPTLDGAAPGRARRAVQPARARGRALAVRRGRGLVRGLPGRARPAPRQGDRFAAGDASRSRAGSSSRSRTGASGSTSCSPRAWPVEASGWKRESGTAIDSRPDTLGFYTEIARWAAARGILRLAFLRLDGRAIAFELALEDNGVYAILKGGFDVELRKFGPGGLITHDELRAGLRARASGATSSSEPTRPTRRSGRPPSTSAACCRRSRDPGRKARARRVRLRPPARKAPAPPLTAPDEEIPQRRTAQG